MTRLGKFLVFFNLAFSLLLATWAFSLYANGIDWSNNKTKVDQPPGVNAHAQFRANLRAPALPLDPDSPHILSCGCLTGPRTAARTIDPCQRRARGLRKRCPDRAAA